LKESYEQIRQRHVRELRDWVAEALEGGVSINAAARRAEVNAGTFWRMVRRYGDASVLPRKPDV